MAILCINYVDLKCFHLLELCGGTSVKPKRYLVWKCFTWCDDDIQARYQVVGSARSTAMKKRVCRS